MGRALESWLPTVPSGLTYLKLFTCSGPFSTCVRWAEWYFLHRVDVRAQRDKAHRALAFLFVKSVTLLFSLAVTTREDTRRVHLPPASILLADLSHHHSLPQSWNNVGHCSKGLGSTWPRSPRLLENSGIKTLRNIISFPSFRESLSQWAGAGSSLCTHGPSLLSFLPRECGSRFWPPIPRTAAAPV